MNEEKSIGSKTVFLSLKYKVLICLILAVILGVNIYTRSDMPPYGVPINELSDNYWGTIVDIAHRWRDFNLSFWNREIGGGLSLYSSGLYPILSPTNILAWFLNDDSFYLVKLIEPYVIGFFFMMLLLWDGFKTRWYIAVFGGMAYMGLTIAKSTTIAESPYFLLGCGLFPAMMFAAIKLHRRHIFLTAISIGAVLALQFAMEGTTQFNQMVIWWAVMLTLIYIYKYVFTNRNIQDKLRSFPVLMVSLGILLISAFGSCAVQLFPTIYYFKFGSFRLAGHYDINNFGIFFVGKSIPYSLMDTVIEGFFGATPVRHKAFLALAFFTLGLSVIHFGRIFKNAENKSYVYMSWIATIIFFLIPPIASQLASWFPFFKKLFMPLTYFTFMYALHVLDFCIILSICLVFNDENLSFFTRNSSCLKVGIGLIFIIAAITVSVLPLILFLKNNPSEWIERFPWLRFYTVTSLKKAVSFLIKPLILIVLLSLRPRFKFKHILLPIFLFSISFMMLLDCFKWYDKGCRTHPELFQLESPERKYYEEAKGKYIHPYHYFEPEWIANDYNLLYGVHGTSGFLALSPYRLMRFQFYFYRRHLQHVDEVLKGGCPRFLYLSDDVLPSSITTYFPIDFTLAKKDIKKMWDGFHKVVEGDKFDVYEREEPTHRVYFANKLKKLNILNIVRKYDEDRSSVVYVEDKDADRFNIREEILNGNSLKARYRNFYQLKGDYLSFEVNSPNDVFAIVPEMFADGWKVYVDGKRVRHFPAYYLFIGFKVPKGSHFIEMKYTPPWLALGIIINVFTVVFLVMLGIKIHNDDVGKRLVTEVREK